MSELAIAEPLSVDRTTLLQGQVLTATASIRNSGNTPVPSDRIMLVARVADADRATAPDLSFRPDQLPDSIAPQETVHITASMFFERDARPGQYEAALRLRNSGGPWRDESTTRFELRPSPQIRIGANLISTGNQYMRIEYEDAHLTELLATLKESGLSQISIRVIWHQIEPSQGVYDERNISALKRILEQAEAIGLDVMLDFHTLFNEHTQSWQAPAWMAELPAADSVNGERLPPVSMKHLFYSPAILDAFIAMQRHVVIALQEHESLKYISLMNEPYLNWASGENERYFEAALGGMLEQLRALTDIPMGVRWLASWHPWSDEPRKRIASSLWRSLDFVAMNLYFDPWNDEQRTEDTQIWPMALRARSAALEAGKPFFVSEIGTTAVSSTERVSYWRAAFANRIRPLQPDLVMIWNGQNDGDFYPSKPDSFNFLSGPSRLAPYAREAILEQVTSTN